MRSDTVKQFAGIIGIMVMLLVEFVGCAGVVPSVYWTHESVMPAGEPSVTTLYPDGSLKRCLGKGSIMGRIRRVDVYPDMGVLKLTLITRKGKEYTINLPGWRQAIPPVESDWVVELDYMFSQDGDRISLMAQGQGQVLMYYRGDRWFAGKTDHLMQCKFFNQQYKTVSYKTMACKQTLAHFSVKCLGLGGVWTLNPDSVRLIDARSALRPLRGTVVLDLVDAYRINDECGRHKGQNMLSYYWFRTPYAVDRDKLVMKRRLQ